MHTCELFFTAISHALLQTVQLVLHLFVLSLCLLALSPTKKKKDTHMHCKKTEGLPFQKFLTAIAGQRDVWSYLPIAVHRHSNEQQHGQDDHWDDDV